MNWEKEIKRATWASIPLLVLYELYGWASRVLKP